MNFAQILAASTITTFLAAYAPAIAVPPGYQPSQKSGANITAIEKPCQPLSWEAANRLPSWLSGSYVACMNPTIADLQASRRARALLVKAERMQEQGHSRLRKLEQNTTTVSWRMPRVDMLTLSLICKLRCLP
jgi:hypothetical protein